jgi:pimeloyl-ACP methyl ester carboxylesterase
MAAAVRPQGEKAVARVVSNGVTIRYRVEGDGPPLILQHGFTDSSETWYELGYVETLKREHRLILIDARGHGQSDKPHDPQSYTPAHYAADMVAVLDDIGVRKCWYWGYSQGGWQVFAMARHAPDRVAGFVVGGASASSSSAYPTEPGNEDPLLAALREGPNGLAKFYGEWVTDEFRERLLASDIAALIACRQQRLATEDFADVVGKITVPTVLYAGSADPIHGPARQSASEIPGAEFISLDGLGHSAALCRSDLVLPQVQRFMTRAVGR